MGPVAENIEMSDDPDLVGRGTGTTAETIEERRTGKVFDKPSSKALQATAGCGGGMFQKIVDDRAQPKAWESHQVSQSSEEITDNFQDVFRRLRRTGRDDHGERDVSDSVI